MTLYLIGIGLNDEQDITLKGLDAVKKCDVVYLEKYTSTLSCPIEKLEKLYGKKITCANREMVEKNADVILEQAKKKNVAFLVIGDVFGATTHTDLFLRARTQGITVQVIHNASILTAVSVCGLELYKFGKTTSIPYPQKNFSPTSYYDIIVENQKNGAHTLLLLDIKAEQGRLMTIAEGLTILLDAEKLKKKHVLTDKTRLLGLARVGGESVLRYGTAAELAQEDFGPPPHCLIIPGKLHFIEEEALDVWKIDKKKKESEKHNKLDFANQPKSL
ncbi:MAG: diphthine synthase [Nanoarchaeota archaeon]